MPSPEFQDPTEFSYDIARNGMPESPIERAKRLGTYRKLDRSRQYAEQYGGRYSNEALKRDIDFAHHNIRDVQRARFRYAAILAVISGIMGNAAAIGKFVAIALRWLGL